MVVAPATVVDAAAVVTAVVDSAVVAVVGVAVVDAAVVAVVGVAVVDAAVVAVVAVAVVDPAVVVAAGTVVVFLTIVFVVAFVVGEFVVLVVENTVQFSGPISATVKSEMCNNTFSLLYLVNKIFILKIIEDLEESGQK